MVLCPKRDQNVCLTIVKKDHLSAIALMKRTLLRQITHPFHEVFCSSDANTSCSFTKQDFTFKQAYCVSSCFVLLYEPNYCQLTLVFSAFYRIHSEITLFCTTPSWQIISCHVRDATLLRLFWFIAARHYCPSFRNLSWINVGVKSVGTKIHVREKRT